MRTLTTAQQYALESKDQATWTKVWIKDSGSTWRDMTDLEGFDWVKSISIVDDIDSPTMTANIQLFREQSGTYYTLSPLMEDSPLNLLTGSYSPLVDIGREVRIEIAVMGQGVTPESSDYENVFEGQIDNASFESIMTLACRDTGGKLIDNFIETQHTYGSSAGVAVETVMQSILTDNSTGVTLWTPVSPSWGIAEYVQQKEPVMTALTTLASQIGWLVKYRYDEGTSAWRLKFYEPGRSKTTPDWTFSADTYYTNNPSIKIDSIRNKVRVVYRDSATGDRTVSEASDSASITKYGTRFMEVAEDDSSNIDTSGEADDMRDAILADLKDPDLNQTTEIDTFWPIETGDLYRFSANDINYSTDQDLAVSGWSTDIDDKKSKTRISVQGKPSGGYRKWLRMEARPGMNPTADFIGPIRQYTPTRYSLEKGMGAFHLNTRSEPGTLIPNQDFGQQSRVTDGSGWPPDFWNETAYGAWGPSGDVYVDTSLSQTGDRSLYFRDTSESDVRLESNFIPVTEGDLYVAGALVRGNSVDAGDSHQIYIQFYQIDQSTTVGSPYYIYNSRATGSTWLQANLSYVNPVPTNARWAKIYIKKTTSTDHKFYVDSIRLNRARAGFYAINTSGQTISSGAVTTGALDTEAYDYGNGMNLTTNEYTFQSPGIYYVSARTLIDTTMSTRSKFIELKIQSDLGAGFVVNNGFQRNYSNYDGYINSTQCSGVFPFNAGDKLKMTIEHDNGVSLDFFNAFAVIQVEQI